MSMHKFDLDTTYFIGDTHFQHNNIIKSTRADNNHKCRPFGSIQEHDEAIINNWNATVSKSDTVVHLGDVMWSLDREDWNLFDRLNGKKYLIVGNHDLDDGGKKSMYNMGKHFHRVNHMRTIPIEYNNKRYCLRVTHVPMHEYEFCFKPNSFCVHGHIHEKNIPNPRYINVSCENIGYRPILLREIMDEIVRRETEFPEEFFQIMKIEDGYDSKFVLRT